MEPQTERIRPSLPGALGMHCSLLSLASGAVSLVVTFLLWWRMVPHDIKRIGQHVGLFSVALGLALAGIGLASQRKRVRRVAVAALVVNIMILSFLLDSIFTLVRW